MQPESLNLNTHSEHIFEELADRLIERGWHVIKDYFDPNLIKDLLNDLEQFHSDGALTPAGVGRGGDFKLDENIRGDITRWLTRSTEAQIRYLDQMETLRCAMNRLLFLGLFDYESHFAIYEPGAYYRKHKDSFRGAAGRILTTVTYLNETWQDQDGGFLIIYNDSNGQEEARIAPLAGTLVVFLSEEIPHEVATAYRLRQSVAGWFKCNTGEVV